MMTKPCPVVFDLDGTLIDSVPDIHACVNAVLRESGIPLLPLDRVRSFVGGGVELLWSRIITARGLDPADRPRLLAAFMARYHDATALTRLYPGAAEALAALAELGHPLGICTNKPIGPTRNILAHFGMDKLFGAVIGGDSLPQKKPHPAPLQATFAALGDEGATPHGLFVGDSEFDAGAAEAAQIPFLLFTEGYRHTPVEDLPHLARFARFPDLVRLVMEWQPQEPAD